MTKLYEISNDYQRLIDTLLQENEDGELGPQALNQLTALQDTLEHKAITLAKYIGNLKAECLAVTAARKAMQERERRLTNKMASLESYLETNMTACGITEISSSPYFTIKVKKCPPSVEITHPELLPAAYAKEKIVTSPDKLMIASDIKAGMIVPGAVLQQKNRVEIK